MTPNDLGKLWALSVKHKATLGHLSEAIIEQVYRIWLQPGDVAVDIGANVGQHLFPLADAVGKNGQVFGFEPIPELAQGLSDRIVVEGFSNRIFLQNMAISDFCGTSQFHHNLAVPAMSGFKVRTGLPDDSQERILNVRVETLDAILGDKSPRFVKIDVEGAEYSVFKGAVETMNKSRPLFAFEDGRAGSAALNNYTMREFYNFFEQQGYAVLDIFGFEVGLVMNYYAGPWNFFATPKEELSEARDAIVYGSIFELWSLMPE